MKVTILKHFVDANDFSKEYNPGEVVDTFSKERINTLVEKGLVSIEDEQPTSEKVEAKKSKK